MESTTNGVGLAESHYAKHTKRLIKLIGDIRALGGEGLLELPRIAVIGNQSAGKSSLIEAISGITVPRAQGTCTRCPMECRLTQKPNSVWHCQVLLRRETDRNGKPLLDIHEIPFGDVIHSTTQLEDRLRRAQLAILNPDTSAEVILSVKESDLQNYPRQLPFSSNVVCVDVWGPDVPDLSFIDLPGIIQNETEAGSMDAIKNMVKKHVQGPCIILLTITMRDDIENQNAAQVAKEADPTGVRTIGVLTKADTVLDGEEPEWLNILEGRKHEIALGYFITKQPGPKDQLSHADARKAERNFFANHPTWSACSSVVQGKMGTEQLGVRLSSLLSNLIDRTLPKLRNDVHGLQQALNEQLEQLPEKLTQQPNLEMMKLVTKISDKLNLLAQGESKHRQIIQACNPAYKTFQQDIRATAPVFSTKTRSEAITPSARDTSRFDFKVKSKQPYQVIAAEQELDASDDSDDETRAASTPSSNGKPRKAKYTSPAIYLDDLRNLVTEHVTRELPYNVPYGAKAELIVKCFNQWEKIAFKCADAIIAGCRKEALETTKTVFGGYTFSSLDRASASIVEGEIATLATEVKARIKWLIGMEAVPYTQNLHYFSDYREKYLTQYKSQRPQQKEISDNYLAEEALKSLRAIGFKLDSVADLSKLREADEYEQELLIAAEVRAYFQVAYKRIIDMVPRIIDQDFVRELRPRMHNALEVKFFTDEKAAARYLAEDPDVTARREDLEAKSRRLGEIDAKLDSLNSGDA